MRDFLLHAACPLKILTNMFFDGFTSFSVFSSFGRVFDAVPSNIDKVNSVYPSANIFVLEVFNIYYEDWLTILVEPINLLNLALYFLSQTILIKLSTFQIRSLTVIFLTATCLSNGQLLGTVEVTVSPTGG